MKSPFLNIATIVVGALLFLSGVLKASDMFSSVEFGGGGMMMKLPKHDSWFYIIVINIIGGIAYCYHAIATYRFKKPMVDQYESDLSKADSTIAAPANISRLALAAGIVSLIIAIWLAIETVVLFTGFENADAGFLPFAIVLFIVSAPFPLFPLLLVGKNLALSSRLGQIKENQQKAEIRSRAMANRGTRR